MSEGYSPGGALIQASDGNFYGVTTEGGSGFSGAVFNITPSGTLTILHGFSFEEGIACSSLVESADGTLYGCTGGSGDSGGEVYKVTTTGVVSSFYSFSASDGDGPTGLIQGSDGNFYGTTYFGGPGGNGTIFQLTPGGVITTIYGFSPSQGSHPSALLQASDGNFYGLLQYGLLQFGGVGNAGTIFRITPAGVLTTIENFIGVDGALTTGGELMQGFNGSILGATLEGGLYDDGVLFTLTVNSPVHTPSVITGPAETITNDSVVVSSSVTADGGETQAWVEYTTDSSMLGSSASQSTGHSDVGSAPGAVAFSTQITGLMPSTPYYYQAFASNSAGTGSGAVATFTTASASTYTISGVVTSSGAGLSGVTVSVTGSPVLSTSPDGSGQYSYTVWSGGDYIVTPFAVGYTFILPSVSFNNLNANQVANFEAVVSAPSTPFSTLVCFSGANGASPGAGLILASDGNFYGTTEDGGASNVGTVFKLTPSGVLTTLHSFNKTDGSNPSGALVQATNGSFYGNTWNGTGSQGTIFQIALTGAFTSLASFSSSGQNDGDGPAGALIQATDGNLYGVTLGMGAFNPPTVFRISLSGALTTLYTFGWMEGGGPMSGLLQASDWNFYGTIAGGDVSIRPGLVFKMTPSGAATPLYAFCQQANCDDGITPAAGLIQGTDGNLYGTAAGGASWAGVIFKLTLAGTYTLVHSFDFADGAVANSLLLAPDGNFYGTTQGGGPTGDGTLFQFTPTGTLTTLHVSAEVTEPSHWAP